MSIGSTILICHYRVGKTDGVSIEIDTWRKILTGLGVNVKLCSGEIQNDADFVISNFESQLNATIFSIDEYVYGDNTQFKDDKTFVDIYNSQKELFKKQFRRVIEECNPDYVLISNVFSVGYNFPAIEAMFEVLENRKQKTVVIHHDFYWEECRYRKPRNEYFENILKKLCPPNVLWMRHLCINSIAQKELYKRTGIRSNIMHDSINFSQKPWIINEFNCDLLNECNVSDDDLIVLQATRIVRRKNIEISMDFVKRLGQLLESSTPFKLCNGRIFDPKRSKIYLLLPGYVEKRDEAYFNTLKIYAKNLGISVLYVSDKINYLDKMFIMDKIYSLWDVYPFANLIIYPSGYEGFGNQLLEAVFARKPIILFEYPVFKTDIKATGVEYVSLGDCVVGDYAELKHIPQETLENAVNRSIELLKNEELSKNMTNNNFNIFSKHFSVDNTVKVLLESLTF